MFDHGNFERYSFANIPLDQDIFVIDEIYIEEYENSMMRLFEGANYENVGYVSYVGVRRINNNSLELSLFPNVFDRFHEVSINLPKEQFVACVGCLQCEERPRIFVKSAWLKNIHLRFYSVFALIDAIGVKDALGSGKITREKLIALRSEIDLLSKNYLDIAFISFADTLLLKSNWTVGHFESDVRYSYEPEIFICLANKINEIYQRTLGLSTYSIVVQGSNEYYDDTLLHISESKNHISLNSLGIPFAQLLDIDRTVKKAIKNSLHPPSELYLDELYYRSLKYKYGFDKNAVQSNPYQAKMIRAACKYYYSTVNEILDNLENAPKKR